MNLNRIKEIREDKDISQECVAKILKISRPYYANIENNIKIITLDKLNLFINYFNISFDYVFGLTNIRQNSNYKSISKIDYTLLGKNITKLRQLNNVTQKELADNINVSQACLSKYEKGLIKISTNNLCKIIHQFNESVDKIIKSKL